MDSRSIVSQTRSQFEFHTFGCKVNTYDTGRLQALVAGDSSSEAELAGGQRVHVLNSCAVTAEATREVLRLARRLKRKDQHCLVVVTGCASQVDTPLVEAEPAVDLIVANTHKDQLKNLIAQKLKGGGDRVHKANIFQKKALE